MAEIKTADASDGSIKVQSSQTDPTPKSDSGNASESTGTASKPKRKGSAITSKTGPERDRRGVVKTNWDNPAADPNERKHIGESPDGKGNEFEE